MPRIIGVDIPGNKRVEYSLQYLYGIGPTKALEIIEKVGIDRNIKASELTPEQIEAYTSIGGTPHLDNQYTVFGEIVSGMDVVAKIEKVKTDQADRPTEDVKIISMEIVK